jgi:hypothetical protein
MEDRELQLRIDPDTACCAIAILGKRSNGRRSASSLVASYS